mgnify:CR=1 FL=1
MDSLTYSEAKACLQAVERSGLEDLLERYGEDVIKAALECGVEPEQIEEAYQGRYSSDKQFAQEMAEEVGRLPKNAQWPYTCIDWEHAAHELMMDYSEAGGHYFRNL